MKTGDVIDVRIAVQTTRGACPLPPTQTAPNIHYLVRTPSQPRDNIQERETQPPGEEVITLKLRSVNGLTMEFRIKMTSTLLIAMQTFAAQARRDFVDCRFLFDGEKVFGHDTPEQVRKFLSRHAQVLIA